MAETLRRHKDNLFWIVTGVISLIVMLPVLTLAATTVGNNVSVGGTLTVTGNSTLSGTLTVTGNSTFNAHTTVGNATSTDIMYLNARIASHLVPTANNSEDIGQFGYAWNNIYASSTAYLAGVSTTAGIYPTSHNTLDVGGYGLAWGSIYASSTAFIPDIHDIAYFDTVNDRVGVTTSSPSADFAVGENATSATTTFDFAKPCFRLTDAAGTQFYMWPQLSWGTGVTDWATSTVTCF